MVSVSGVRIRRRPIADIPMPVIATRSSNFSEATIGRTRTSGSGGSAASAARSGPGSDVGAKIGSHTSSCCSNCTLDAQAHVHGVGFRVDDVGDEADAWVLVERDDRDDVRRREIGQPLLQVDA